MIKRHIQKLKLRLVFWGQLLEKIPEGTLEYEMIGLAIAWCKLKIEFWSALIKK